MGESVRLTPLQQKQIASWVALKNMVSEFDVGGHVTTHYMQRKRMKEIQRPLMNGWAIWIAFCTEGADNLAWSSVAYSIVKHRIFLRRGHVPPKTFNSHATSMIIKKLFVQVVRQPDASFINKIEFQMPDGGKLFRIWPPSHYSIVWPAQALSSHEINGTVNTIETTIAKIIEKRKSY